MGALLLFLLLSLLLLLLALNLSRFLWRIWMHFNVNVAGETSGACCPVGGVWTKPISWSQSVALHALLKQNSLRIPASASFYTPGSLFYVYHIKMQCFSMYKFRHRHTLFLEFLRLFGAQKTTSNNFLGVQSEDGRSKEFSIRCYIDVVISWTWQNSNLTWWKLAIVGSNCKLTPTLCTPEVMIFQVVQASKPCESFW